MQPLRTEDPRRIGEYTVVTRLGAGAMGTVFLARSPGGRRVAIKVVRAELADQPTFRERFRQEVAAMRRVGGFWTAAVVDADPDQAAPWVATDYVPGPTLQEYVEAHGPLPVAMARTLVAGLAEALRAIHGAGLVHRDLKPSNVLLAADGPRVIDFGIAKAAGSAGLTSTGMVIGTPAYLAPAQIEGRPATSASDVFALGAVVTFATTGAGPFGGGDAAGLLYRVVHTAPELDRVPAELRPLVSRCLVRAEGDRPTPDQLLAEIGEFHPAHWTPDEPTEVHTGQKPPTRLYTAVDGQEPDGQAASRAVFETSRRSAVLLCVVTGVAAVTALSYSSAASKLGNGGLALLCFVAFVLLAVPAVRYGRIAVRPRRWVEVSAEGLTVGTGGRARPLRWVEIARARVIEHRRRPWLVLWIDGPDAAQQDLGPVVHGGRRVFPVGHERRAAAREREVRELRAALGWYAADRHDPTR